MFELKQIKASEIIAMLNNGKTRDDIAATYELTKQEMAFLFQQPSLKGKKTKKPMSFQLVDDITGVSTQEEPQLDGGSSSPKSLEENREEVLENNTVQEEV